MYVRACVHIHMNVHMYARALVFWCVGELWMDQRKKCTDVCET